MIARLARLVSIRSLSDDEAAVADCAAAELAAAGLAVRRTGNNIWCETGDRPRPRLLLNSHLDTVPPGDGWEGDPWALREVAGRLVGLGANDAKGCVTALMEAFFAAHRRLQYGEKLGGTLVLALTAEEETSGAGLGTIVSKLAPLDAAIVGEPTGLVPMIAQRGLLVIRCAARGRSSHPANTPADSPDNAIMTAARDLARLQEFDWGPVHPLLGRCHAHVTLINGGVARNVVPDACEFFLDVRTTPAEPHAALAARLGAYLQSEVHVHSARLVPVSTDPEAAIVRAVRRALPDAAPGGSRAMSDMVYLAGTPCVKLGPGESVRSHTPNEYILPQELEAGAATYARVVDAFFRLAGGAVAERNGE